jgi:hypothetical protein
MFDRSCNPFFLPAPIPQTAHKIDKWKDQDSIIGGSLMRFLTYKDTRFERCFRSYGT